MFEIDLWIIKKVFCFSKLQEHPMVMSIYVTLFARIILQNQEYFWTFLEQVTSESHIQVGVSLFVFFDWVLCHTNTEKVI